MKLRQIFGHTHLTAVFAALSLPVVLLAGGALSGCSSAVPADPIEAVPQGATKIKVFNLRKLATAAGARSLTDNGQLTEPARKALEIFIPGGFTQAVAAVIYAGSDAVDIEHVVEFTASNGYDSLIFKVKDFKKLTTGNLNSFRTEADDFGDFKVFSVGHRIVAVSEHLCVIAPDVATARKVDAPRKGSIISEMAGVRQWLTEGDNAVTMVCSAQPLLGDDCEGLWACGSLRFTDNSAVADLCLMQPDGRRDSIGARIAAPLDPALLGFVPQNVTALVAFGKVPEKPLFDISAWLGKTLPIDVATSPVGSTLFYGRPAGSLSASSILDASRWNLASVIKMDQADGRTAVEGMERLTEGYASYDAAQGFHSFTHGDNSISFGYVNGYFAQSVNGPLNAFNSNPFTADFQSARLVAIVDIPADSPLRDFAGLPCAASLTVKVNSENIHAKLSLHGTSAHPLAVLSSTKIGAMLPALLNF